MPIYAYQCSSCGVSKDILRKISDPPLTTCPACGQETLAKQVTAAGFQLKGSGWYVTDFRGSDNKTGLQDTPDKASTSVSANTTASVAAPTETSTASSAASASSATVSTVTSGATA